MIARELADLLRDDEAGGFALRVRHVNRHRGFWRQVWESVGRAVALW